MGIYKGFRQLRCPGNSRPGAYLLHHGFPLAHIRRLCHLCRIHVAVRRLQEGTEGTGADRRNRAGAGKDEEPDGRFRPAVIIQQLLNPDRL